MGKLGTRGYCGDAVCSLFRKEFPNYDISERKDIACNYLKEEQKILAQSQLLDTKEYLETVKDFVAFIGKNLEIIENPNTSMPCLPKVEIENHVNYYHQGRMDDIRNELNNLYSEDREKRLIQELNEDFVNEDLYPCEIKIVKGWIEQWKQRM